MNRSLHLIEKKWEENTRLQDEKKRSEILIQDLRENLQPLESEEQESTPMSNCRSPSEEDVASKQVVYLLGLNPGRFVPEMLMGADYLHLSRYLFGLVLTPDFYSDIYDFTQIFCRYLLKNWDLWSGQSRVQLMFFPQHSKFTQCTMRFRKKRAKNVQL